MKQWWRNRDVILISAVVCGLALGRGATWTQPLILPALAVVMTLSACWRPEWGLAEGFLTDEIIDLFYCYRYKDYKEWFNLVARGQDRFLRI